MRRVKREDRLYNEIIRLSHELYAYLINTTAGLPPTISRSQVTFIYHVIKMACFHYALKVCQRRLKPGCPTLQCTHFGLAMA